VELPVGAGATSTANAAAGIASVASAAAGLKEFHVHN